MGIRLVFISILCVIMYMDISVFLKNKLHSRFLGISNKNTNPHILELPSVHLSELSKIMLEKIIYQYHLGQKAGSVKGAIASQILGNREFPKGVDFNYIFDEIRNDIENMPKFGKRYDFKIGTRDFIIYAVVPAGDSSSNINKWLDHAVKQMYTWLYIASYFCPIECSPQLTIYWYLTDHKKRLPYRKEVINAKHVNTGFTFACPPHPNNIYIYRKEEWFKVFIHETFHSLGLDFAKMPEKPANDAIYSIFPVSCDIRFYEMYTEMWAEIIYILFLCLEHGGENNIFARLENRLQEEQLFSLFQCVKVLHHNNMKYRELTSLKGCLKYKESTNAFSYYILKSISMFFYTDFIDWCVRKNKGTIVFKKTEKNILSLVDFIQSKHNDPAYIRSIQIMENWFSTTKYKGPEMETMRMTSL